MDRLLGRNEVVMAGPVLAEVLQGARTTKELQALSNRLTALPYVEMTKGTWGRVGRMAFELRQRGHTVALVDLLIAALAIEHDHQVYTLDDHFQRIPGLKLYAAGAG